MIKKIKDTKGLHLEETCLVKYLEETKLKNISWFGQLFSWIYGCFKKAILKDRIITQYKSYKVNNEITKSYKNNNEDMLTLDLLYNASRWYNESIFKNIEN